MPERIKKKKKRQTVVDEFDESSDEYEFVDCIAELFVEEHDYIEDEDDNILIVEFTMKI